MLSEIKSISVFTLSLGAGGAEKTISLLLPELVKDYKVFLVLFHHDIHFNIPKEVKVTVLDKNKNRILSFFSIIYEYNKFLNDNKIDVSISFLTRPNLINGVIKIFNQKRIKTIISERCFPSKAYKSNKWRYKLYKTLIPYFYNKADVVFSNSLHINEDLYVNFKVKKTMAVVYNPIEKMKADIISSRNLDREFTISWVGKMVEIKNPRLLIDSLMSLKINYNAFFLGEGILKENLIYEVKDKNIKFYGNVKNVNEFLFNADCFVLTSNSEGFPNVVLEAMACGLPVIATNCLSGPLEILNNNNQIEIKAGEYFVAEFGILINVGDALALSKAILRLYQDSELRLILRKASLDRIKAYSVETIYKEFKILIDG